MTIFDVVCALLCIRLGNKQTKMKKISLEVSTLSSFTSWKMGACQTGTTGLFFGESAHIAKLDLWVYILEVSKFTCLVLQLIQFNLITLL